MELTLTAILKDARIAEAARQDAAREELAASVKESISPALYQLNTGDSEDPNFRRITSPATLRDLNPVMHERMQQICFFLSVTTPFGKRIIRIMVDFVVGEGFKAVADDNPEAQAVIDRFWTDPANKMDENVDALCQELFTFGELCIPVAVNPVDGFVKQGYIDPQEIEIVEYALMETGSSQEVSIPVAVRLRKRIGEAEGRRLTIIHRDEDPDSETFGSLVGDCFYFAINKAKAASRGISELFALADWIDQLDQMMFDFGDRMRILNSFIWQYILKGADNKTVEEYKKKLTKSPPRQGGVQVTNDQIEIKPQSPDLRGADFTDGSRAVKIHMLGGAGMPAFFFSDAVDANRATATEMTGPTGKMLTNKQNVMKRVIVSMVDFVLDQAKAHGVLGRDADVTWKLQVPDLAVKDMGAGATALQTTAGAMGTAEDRGWVRGETAARAFHTVLTQIGIEVDQEEYKLAQKEKQQREAEQQDALDPQKNLADALAKTGRPATELVQ